jgi:putative SOS response-associated peptidase YedK
MCGRYALGRPADELAAELDAADLTGDAVGAEFGADFNVAPGKPVLAVVSRPAAGGEGDRRRELRVLRWGLVPSWSESPDPGARMINARAETVREKPAFRAAVAARRCLVPADGWYEWRERQPYYLTPRDGSVLALAGLYEIWGNGTDRIVSCAIVTTAAVGPLAAIHARMPLVLPRSDWSAWLDPAEPADRLLAPPGLSLVDGLEIRPVGPAVGNVANNGAALTRAVPPPATLF